MTTHFSWDSISGDDLEFDLPTMPTPDFALTNFFRIDDPLVSVNGSVPAVLSQVRFFADGADGGFTMENLVFPFLDVSVRGQQLFTGPTSAPTFVNGTYDLNVIVNSTPTKVGTLYITSAAAAVPEPGVIALLSLGLAGLGFTRRKMKA